MATYTYDAPSRTLTVVFTALEAKAVVRVSQTYGVKALPNHIDGWVTSYIDKFDEADKTAFRSALSTATPTQVDQIKAILGLP